MEMSSSLLRAKLLVLLPFLGVGVNRILLLRDPTHRLHHWHHHPKRPLRLLDLSDLLILAHKSHELVVTKP